MKHFGQLGHRVFSSLVKRSDCSNFVPSQLAVSRAFSSHIRISSLLNTVSVVISKSSHEQMVGIYTDGVITFVKNAWFGFWRRSKMNEPRCPVAKNAAIVQPDFPISQSRPVFKGLSGPIPTTAKMFNVIGNRTFLIHSSPESSQKINGKRLRGFSRRLTVLLHSIMLVDCLPRLRLFVQRAGNFVYCPRCHVEWQAQ